jgi:hypothetical protein
VSVVSVGEPCGKMSRAITDLSRTAYRYFSRLGNAGVEGRLLAR